MHFVFCYCISAGLLLVFGEFIGAWIQGWSWLSWGFRRFFIKCILANTLSMCPAKKSPVLSVAWNPETNTIVAGTELVSSQAVVAFW